MTKLNPTTTKPELTIEALRKAYEENNKKLAKYANMVATSDEEMTTIAREEAVLLNAQEEILRKAATIPLNTSRTAAEILRFWEFEQYSEDHYDIMTGKLVANVRCYLESNT
jgi:hypothetical protein